MPEIESEAIDGLLTVRHTPDSGRIRVALEGELDLSCVKTAEAPLLDALGSGEDVLIDLAKLEFIDSTGISLLVMALRIKESGLSFVASESAEVSRLLSLTGLDGRMKFVTDAKPLASVPSPPDGDLPQVLPAA